MVKATRHTATSQPSPLDPKARKGTLATSPLPPLPPLPQTAVTGFFRYQPKARWFYFHQRTQYTIAALIFANFFANIFQAQIDPFGKHYHREFLLVEDLFNYIFLIELIINMYASWRKEFVHSGWNWFDVLVVIVGVLSIMRVDLPGPFSLLRMLRAFRVFRLFKRIKSLQKIILSLARAVPGMLNAGFIMVLVMCIYAILAVEYFGEHGVNYDNETGTYEYVNIEGQLVDSVTARGLSYGNEYFGTFLRSLFTLFQVLTGESWAEAVARPALFGGKEIAASVFFVSFVLVNTFVLINVVVAVLLEKCLDPSHEELLEEEEAAPEAAVEVPRVVEAETALSCRCRALRSSSSRPGPWRPEGESPTELATSSGEVEGAEGETPNRKERPEGGTPDKKKRSHSRERPARNPSRERQTKVGLSGMATAAEVAELREQIAPPQVDLQQLREGA
ncbi:hypothetical protein AB1Y20_013157 [Prymnesium parvum]|uniref:Ion transport domain-containing protein n=1 Tax=Prymnesium parvum TaxID=97485 RepID=A0AB34IKR2_PRYPA